MKKKSPMWWLLYAIVPLMVGAVLLITRAPLDTTERRIAEGIVVVGGFALMGVWANANESILWAEELHEAEWRPQRHAEEDVRSHPIALAPRARLNEPLPRTGFGSRRGRRDLQYERELVTTNVVRVVARTQIIGKV